jgi:hypothetical protein
MELSHHDHKQHEQHVGRRLADAVAHARGQTPLRYDLEVVTHFAGAPAAALLGPLF